MAKSEVLARIVSERRKEVEDKRSVKRQETITRLKRFIPDEMWNAFTSIQADDDGEVTLIADGFRAIVAYFDDSEYTTRPKFSTASLGRMRSLTEALVEAELPDPPAPGGGNPNK